MLKTELIVLVLTIAYVLFHLNSGKKDEVKAKAYQWWYMPWFALIYTGLMYLLYDKANFPDWPIINNIFQFYNVEGIFFVVCASIWTALEYFLLRKEDVHNKLIVWFRKLVARKIKDKDKILPFPYFLDNEGEVRSKVGLAFYRYTMKTFVVIIALAYVVCYVLAAYVELDFYMKSGLGLLMLLPLVDYYVYLCCEPETENVEISRPKHNKSDFDELWQLYIDTFSNYSVAWKRTLSDNQIKDNINTKNGNDNNFDFLFKKFTEEYSDVLVENWDLTSAFMKLERFFNYVDQNGKYVLIAIDVPSHFVNSNKTFIDEIADKLREILNKDVYVYGGESTVDMLNNSIILAPLSLISSRGLYKEWMEKIGLITVINIFDKNVANIFECMRFSYVVQSVNDEYQIVFVTPDRRGIQAAFENTWKRKKGDAGRASSSEEKKKKMFPVSQRQFFIGYNYEDYLERFSNILKGFSPDALCSGGEMSILALSTKVYEKEKIATPLHYLDLAYSNAIESVEEVGRSLELLMNKYSVAPSDVNNNVNNHIVPVDQIKEEQILSVIFDQDNNAPAAYTKWEHLGLEENFAIVVSKPYLFRDYFNSNHSYFMEAPVFLAIQPHPSKSKITLAIILLKKLKNATVEENELRGLLTYYYDNEEIKSVSSLIKGLFATYFTRDLAKALSTEDVVEFDGEKYNHHIYYTLKLNLYNDNEQDYLNTVKVIEESGNELFEILRDLMEQNYVHGQIHSFSGRPYKIKDFNKGTDGKRSLIVSKVNNPDKDTIFYKPSLEVKLSGHRTPIKEMNPSELKPKVWKHSITNEDVCMIFDGFETNVNVNTLNWFEFYKYTIFDCSKTESTTKPRQYSNGKVLKITLKFIKKPEYLQRADDIRKGLQILLYEAMRSMFPQHAQYLIISSIGEGDDELPWIFTQLKCEEADKEGELTYYFIEDAHIDLGLIGALADIDNIKYIFRCIFDYLVWLTEGEQLTPENFENYLEQKQDKLAFLKYGRKTLPNYFDIDLLINFIKDYYEDSKTLFKEVVGGRQKKQAFKGVCDFCGREMKNSEMQRLEDGRMRCPDCSIDAIDTIDQFDALCKKVKQAFKDHLGIDFESIPHKGNLVPAVELHKLSGEEFSITNGYDARKLLGVAFSNLNEFFVENGYKPDKTFGIIAHEMTHIWQYNNADFQKVRTINENLVEGLAVWTDLFLSEKNGASDIDSLREVWLARTDEYGRGLKFIMDNCPDDPYGYIKEKACKM